MEYITLLGAEQIQTAANTMRHAAEEMKSVAGNIDYSLDQHHRFMTDWLDRFENIIGQLILSGK